MIKSRIRNAGHLTRMGDKKIPKRVLVRYSEGNRPLGRPGLRWEDNIKMNVKEISGKLWTGFIYLRLVAIGRLL